MTAALSVEVENGRAVAKTDLADVEIATHDGDLYHFPAMSKSGLELVLPKGSNRLSDASLTMANASTSILMVPMRIIKRVLVDGEVWWVSPV